ncbi:MAG: methylated-DNA--[protein]-cysteine S-methyltransferase [Hyphomicrobiaceae bacterium]
MNALNVQPLLNESFKLPGQGRDYDVVCRAIRFLTEQAQEQPELEVLAAHLKLSPAHTQKLFTRWCGLSPKEFLQAITIDAARRMLEQSANVLETSHEVGLSGSSRLHDLFVSHEAVTPGDVKRRGAGLVLSYGFHETPFGEALAAMTDRGLAALAFIDEDKGATRDSTLREIQSRWPSAEWIEATQVSAASVAGIFAGHPTGAPIRIVLIGTNWEVQVWQALLKVPAAHAVSYVDVARSVCTQRAARAVGTAVGRNPLAFVVPCHRVRRADGGLGGYHWNVTRKQAIIGWEAGQVLKRPT